MEQILHKEKSPIHESNIHTKIKKASKYVCRLTHLRTYHEPIPYCLLAIFVTQFHNRNYCRVSSSPFHFAPWPWFQWYIVKYEKQQFSLLNLLIPHTTTRYCESCRFNECKIFTCIILKHVNNILLERTWSQHLNIGARWINRNFLTLTAWHEIVPCTRTFCSALYETSWLQTILKMFSLRHMFCDTYFLPPLTVPECIIRPESHNDMYPLRRQFMLPITMTVQWEQDIE